ncbi:MAG: periplasmic chaperone for outer membrane protein SurA [Deltaproteobacteria bacterium]|jgi:peptidyl-prolyl cis-trans isomerase SurA|nr:periplasmic chaperone for outer membrane protein SurA [Deltaproteobacteria bacterium]
MRREGRGILALATGAVLLCLAAPGYGRVIDGVVAVVNDEPVTFSEVRESVAEALGIPVGDADGFLREERDSRIVIRWIEALVEAVLVRQELVKQGQPVPDADIDKAVESVRKSNGMSEAQFVEILGREGLTLATYRRRLRWQMERGAIVRAKKFKDVSVTEQEVREYFRENADRFLVGSQVQEEAIFLPFPAADPQAAGDPAAPARFAAQQAAEAIRGGKTIREAYELARRTLPAAQWVECDFVPVEDLLPEMQRELRRLRTGDISQPFFTEAGIYIIRVVARRGGKTGDFAPVKESLTEELTDRRSEKAYADILAELKRTASIDVRL